VRAVDVIAHKRDGQALTAAEIGWFVTGFLDGAVTDYQAAAWLMAVYLRGMNLAETAELTRAMAASGRTLDLGSLAERSVDKHSSGGVGDKISLVAGPIAAAAGVVVPKMSGRGLGITGGTLDKLESIPGLSVDLTEDQILRQARDIGFVIAGQTAELAPADGRLYALRDVTATVASLPLIVSSIMSKKLAGGAPSIVLDVKAGSGAFMPTVESASELARALVEVGMACGRRVVAYVTPMDEPLGRAVGNALEVREAIEVLSGRGPADASEIALTLAAEMATLAGVAGPGNRARRLVEDVLASGAALDRLRRMIGAQGGDARVVDEPNRLPTAPVVETIVSTQAGFVRRLDAGAVGRAVAALGAGRERKGEPIDHRVGVLFYRKVGDRLDVGDPLFDLHLANAAQLPAARERILGAYDFASAPVAPGPLILGQIDGAG
jgi:pyrimidine-nucleoside phosphorylase